MNKFQTYRTIIEFKTPYSYSIKLTFTIFNVD